MRGHNVILDSDLAKLYDVTTGALIRQVRRNPRRFPRDFMFQLSMNEWSVLKSQLASQRDVAVGAMRRTCSRNRVWQCFRAS